MPEAPIVAGDLAPALRGESATTAAFGIRSAAPRWPVFVGVALLAGLLAVGWLQTSAPGLIAQAQVGAAAPDFTLTTFDGKTVTLSDLRGHPVVINFWASWCPPCRTEAAALGNVARAEQAANRAEFIGVNVRDWEDNALRFIADFDVPYMNGPDPGTVERQYGGAGLPYTVFVDADGTIARTWIGPLDEQRLLSIIDEIA